MTLVLPSRLALAALAVTAPAALSQPLAQALAQDTDGAARVVIDDAVATVTFVRGEGDRVEVSGGDASAMSLRVDERDGTVRIAGPRALDEDAFWDDYMASEGRGIRIGPLRLGRGSRSIVVENGRDARFEALLADYPELTVTVPEGTDLQMEGSALFVTGDVRLGRVEAEGNVYLIADLGDADSARLRMRGPGDLALGDVTGLIDAELSGSGDISFGDAGSAVLALRGSGDIEGGDVAGDAALSLQGSGDIETGGIGGAAEMRLRGSGDIDVGAVSGLLDAELQGSGDIEVDEVAGPVIAALRGSGDIEIGGGRAERFEARLAGSGDISFGGVAVNPKLTTSGSGDIVVDRSEGTVETSGDGIRVDGRRYGEDD